jgi:hypothetical protein
MVGSLRGLIAQGIDGRKVQLKPCSRTFAPTSLASESFVAPEAGWYEFAGWGAGTFYFGAGSASGAFGLRLVYLSKGQAVSIQVGKANQYISSVGGGALGANTNTSLTFPDGSTMIIGSANSGAPSGGVSGAYDVAISSNVTPSTSAVSAPSYTSQFGNVYLGGGAAGTKGFAPGGGMGQVAGHGTDGSVIVNRVFR